MVSNDKKRVQVTLKRDQIEKLDSVSQKVGLTKSEAISLLLSGALAYLSGEALGEALGSYLKRAQERKEDS